MGDAELPTEITLRGNKGDLKIRVIIPASRGLRYQVMYAAAKSEELAFVAALGLCSVALRKRGRWDYDVLGFGARLLDWLLEEGATYLQVIEAGRIAWLHVTRGLDTHAEIDQTEGFSEAKGGSTS